MLNKFAKRILTKIFIAQMQRIIKKHQPKIIAVVGSVGKTTTKLAIAEVLKTAFSVQVQQGNYNTPLSIPFIFIGRELPALYNPFGWLKAWLVGQNVLSRPYPYEIVIVELGTDTPGDLAAFKDILTCDISVITAISEEHMANFANLDAVAKEELTIALFSRQLLINTDDVSEEYLTKYVASDVPKITYGVRANADYVISTNRTKNQYLKLIISCQKQIQLEAETKMIAIPSVKSLAAAATLGFLLKMPSESIKTAINQISPPAGRMQLITGIKDSLIIDDSYNASPLAVKAALDTLYNIEAPQKIAVLGMMNELGDYSAIAHREIGAYCQPTQINLLITIGKDANGYLAEAAANNGCRVVRCHTPYEAGGILAAEIVRGALVLVKGSQNGVFAEEAIKSIVFNQQDISRLVRQNKFWLAKKQAQIGAMPNIT